MCCSTDSFFCTKDQKQGIIVAGCIDLGLLFVIGIVKCNFFVAYNADPYDVLWGYWIWDGVIWDLIVVIATILLIIGVAQNISGLLLTWMIVSMINIVLLFISLCISLPLLFTYQTVGLCTYHSRGRLCGDPADRTIVLFTFLILQALVKPSYHIYLWVVVKSYNGKLAQGGMAYLPTQVQPG